jgi:hypothetical protein
MLPSLPSPVKEEELEEERMLMKNGKPHDAIDFTDNDIQMLGNFPLSPRLRTLLLARNRISSIQPSLANSIPHLTTLVLTSNNFAELADLDVLATFGQLTHLVLLENPVTRKEVSLRISSWEWPEWLLMGTELSVLGPVEMSDCEISGLQESEGCGA